MPIGVTFVQVGKQSINMPRFQYKLIDKYIGRGD